MGTLLNLEQIFGAEPPIAAPTLAPSTVHKPEESAAEANFATRDELALWLYILRSDGASIGLKDGVSTIDWPAHLDTPGRRRDWVANLAITTEILTDQAAPMAHRPPTLEPGRRLIGCGFPPRHSQAPPELIIATPRIMCPKCGQRPVLAELRAITGGRCWPCWELETAKRANGDQLGGDNDG